MRDNDGRAARPSLVDKREILLLGGAKVVQSLVEIPDSLPLDTHHPLRVSIHEPHAGVHLGDEEGLHLSVTADAAPTLVEAAHEGSILAVVLLGGTLDARDCVPPAHHFAFHDHRRCRWSAAKPFQGDLRGAADFCQPHWRPGALPEG